MDFKIAECSRWARSGNGTQRISSSICESSKDPLSTMNFCLRTFDLGRQGHVVIAVFSLDLIDRRIWVYRVKPTSAYTYIRNNLRCKRVHIHLEPAMAPRIDNPTIARRSFSASSSDIVVGAWFLHVVRRLDPPVPPKKRPQSQVQLGWSAIRRFVTCPV